MEPSVVRPIKTMFGDYRRSRLPFSDAGPRRLQFSSRVFRKQFVDYAVDHGHAAETISSVYFGADYASFFLHARQEEGRTDLIRLQPPTACFEQADDEVGYVAD